MKRRLGIPVWARVALAPVLLLGVVWAVDFAAVGRQLARATPGWLLLALACSVVSNLVSAWRWRSLVHWLGQPLHLGQAQRAYFQSMAIGALMPGAVVGGDVYRAYVLRRQGQGTLVAGWSVVLDRLSGVWILFVLGALGAAWGIGNGDGDVDRLARLGLSPAAWLAVALALLGAPMLGLWTVGRAARGTTGARNGGPVLARWIQLAARPGRRAEYGRQVLGSTLGQLLSIGALACGGRSLGLELPYWCYAVVSVPMFLMASLPIGFGGWGTRETAAVVSLAAFGVAAPTAVAVSVLFGLVVLPQALVGAGLLLTDGARTRTASRPTQREPGA